MGCVVWLAIDSFGRVQKALWGQGASKHKSASTHVALTLTAPDEAVGGSESRHAIRKSGHPCLTTGCRMVRWQMTNEERDWKHPSRHEQSVRGGVMAESTSLRKMPYQIPTRDDSKRVRSIAVRPVARSISPATNETCVRTAFVGKRQPPNERVAGLARFQSGSMFNPRHSICL